MSSSSKVKRSFKDRLAIIVFETNTSAGRMFDIILLWAILLSVAEVMLESVYNIRVNYRPYLYFTEWFFSILFLIEYIVRIYIAKNPWRYIFSFYGLVDLFSIVPTFVGVFIDGTTYLRTIRFLRLLRIFRILKLSRYLNESEVLLKSLKDSRAKITVFLFAVVVVSVIVGTVMYIIEGADAGFTSIPRSIYWAIVTVTTVGFGDITPETVLGQTLASLLMIVGYGIIAVPTGIVSAEFAFNARKSMDKKCKNCGESMEEQDRFCSSCGAEKS